MLLLKRLVRALPLLLLSPFLMAVSFVALLLTDILRKMGPGAGGRGPGGARRGPRRGRRPLTLAPGPGPGPRSASVVIPNWNGKDLLEKYLPSVVEALAGNPDNEIVVVDNGSTDGSADFVRAAFPQVTLLALPRNLGFGGGSNAGIRAARNDIVVLLNSDMRVDPGFLAPLLEGFRDPQVFSVACQIFFADPNKVREETGLTQGWWQDGGLRVRHRIDPAIDDLFPCFYGGGGSCAFDRGKFLELGGFDPLLHPFYLEDTDLGYLAWKRGWKVLYQPRSTVYHQHRGTIGKVFGEERIQAVLKKNYVLFCWKNIHEWPRLASHFFFAWTGALLSVIFGDAPGRPNFYALWRAFLQLPQAVRSRWRARGLARVSDSEAFLRPLGGYFRDRFEPMPPAPEQIARALRFSVPHLPPGSWRRCVHVPDPARDGQTGGSARGRVARLALAGASQPGTAPVLRLRRVDCSPGRKAQGHRVPRAARRPGICQRRSGLAHPPPALSPADRCAPARIHAHGAVSRRVSPHCQRAVRARCALSIDRPRPGPHGRPAGRGEGAHRVSPRAAL